MARPHSPISESGTVSDALFESPVVDDEQFRTDLLGHLRERELVFLIYVKRRCVPIAWGILLPETGSLIPVIIQKEGQRL